MKTEDAKGEEPTSVAKGIGLTLLAMLIFASQDGITKHLSTQYAVPQILMVRYIFFAFFAGWLAWRKGFRRTVLARRPVLQTFRALVIVGEIGVFVIAVRYLPLADTHAIFASTPLIVTALSVPLLGERVGLRRWFAVLIGFGGVLVILRPGIGVVHPGSLVALTAAFMFALYILLTRLGSKRDSSETALLYMAWVGAAIMVIAGPFFWVPPDAEGWFWLLLLGCSSSCGHFSLIVALKHAPAATLQPLNYTTLVWATVIGFFAFGDFPDAFTIAGACIVVGSGLYTIYREHRISRRKVMPDELIVEP